MKDKAAHACHALRRAGVADEMQRAGERTAESTCRWCSASSTDRSVELARAPLPRPRSTVEETDADPLPGAPVALPPTFAFSACQASTRRGVIGGVCVSAQRSNCRRASAVTAQRVNCVRA